VFAVTLTSAEDRKVKFSREQSCISDEAQTVVKKRSRLHLCRHNASVKLSQLAPDTMQDIIEGVKLLIPR